MGSSVALDSFGWSFGWSFVWSNEFKSVLWKSGVSKETVPCDSNSLNTCILLYDSSNVRLGVSSGVSAGSLIWNMTGVFIRSTTGDAGSTIFIFVGVSYFATLLYVLGVIGIQ